MIIRIINDQFNVVGSGGQHRILSFAEALSKLPNIKIELMTPYFIVDYNYFKQHYQRYYIDREMLYAFKNKPKFFLDNTLRLIIKNLNASSPNFYIIGLPVPLLRGFISYSALLRHIPFILDFGDPWFSSSDPLIYRKLMNELLIHFVRQAPAITVPNNQFKAFLLSTYRRYEQVNENNISKLESKIHVLYPAALKIINTTYLRKRSFLEPFTIAHLGDLTGYRMLRLLIYTLKHLYPSIKKVRLLIIGGGRRAIAFKSYIHSHGMNDKVEIIITEPVNRWQVYDYLSYAHIGLSVHEGIYWKPINELKIVDYMAMGLPIISTHRTDILVHGYNSFIVKDEKSFITNIKALIQDYDLLLHMSLHAVTTIEKCCNLYICAKKILLNYVKDTNLEL